MFGPRFWLAWLTSLPLACGAVVTPPPLGFAQNVGQYDSDVLFALGDRIFYRNKVQFTSSLSIQFVGADPWVTPVGQDPVATPLNFYLGSDPQRWRENVPHFYMVRYAQIYPGIDAEWNCGSSSTVAHLPMLRIVITPGGDPQKLLLRLEGVRTLDVRASGSLIVVGSAIYFVFDQLAAYQPAGGTESPVAISFVKVDESSFRFELGNYDPALPLVIQVGRAAYGSLMYPSALAPGYDDTAVLAGGPSIYGPPYHHGYVAKVSLNGSPVFLSLFDGLHSAWVVPGRNDEITVAGTVKWWLGSPAATPGAPRPVVRTDHLDGWVGRFDSRGRLRDATFTGDSLGALAVDAEGAVYFATGEAVVKWVPGSAQFSFTAPVRSVSSLSANSAGGLAFAAAQAEGQPTTAGAYKRRYEGPWDLHVGVLDRVSGRIQMATYVPIIGPGSRPFRSRSSVALAPGGSLWIASSIDSGESPFTTAYTLVAVSADGAREMRSESVPALPSAAFDSQGVVWVAMLTSWPNLPTSPDAPRRAGCYSGYNLHLRTLALDGAPRNATYLPGQERYIIAFDGPDRLFIGDLVGPSLERVDTSPPANAAIACVVHAASRLPRAVVAAGGLSTLVGNQLGPLDQVSATLDGDGKLPLTLAGVQVLVNQVPAPLLSVQQGLITYYTPEDTPRGSVQIEVRSRGELLASTVLSVAGGPDFAVLTTDGSGRGLAVALNQDGIANGPNNPAKWGSVVTVLGTGPLPASVAVTVGYERATVEYAGPAPGAVPGINQVTFRVPSFGALPPTWRPVYVATNPYNPAVPIIYVTP